MASNFSIWLHETARLYLRYTAVGLIGVPLALLYAWARHSDWNMSVVSATLLLLGFVSAFLMWRRLGNWQTPSAKDAVKATHATSDAWTDLVNATFRITVVHQQSALCFQQLVGIDGLQLRASNYLPRIVVASKTEVEALEVALKNVPAQQKIEIEQEQYIQSVQCIQSIPKQTRQRQPAWALALRGQPQNAPGLA